MRGMNTLKLNQQTMMEAVQCWADTQFKEPVTVSCVSKDTQDYGSVDSFVVQFNSNQVEEHTNGQSAQGN